MTSRKVGSVWGALLILVVEVLLRVFKGAWGMATFNLSMQLVPHSRTSSVHVGILAACIAAVARMLGDAPCEFAMASAAILVAVNLAATSRRSTSKVPIVTSLLEAPTPSDLSGGARAGLLPSTWVAAGYLFVMLWAARELVWLGMLLSNNSSSSDPWVAWLIWSALVLLVYVRRIDLHHLDLKRKLAERLKTKPGALLSESGRDDLYA